MENNKNKKSVNFHGDMLNFCDFIQVFVFTTNHHLKHNFCVQKSNHTLCVETPGPEVIKLFSCSTQLSMKFFLLINVKMPTIVGILTFMSKKNSILG